MLKKGVQHLLGRFGLRIVRTALGNGRSDGEFSRIACKVQGNTLVPQAGLFSLYQQALFCETQNLPGDFVECGVWKGGAVGLMALVNLGYGRSRRHIHLFDSFEEICEPDEAVDGERAVREAKQWSRHGQTKGRLIPLKGFYDHLGGPGSVSENEDLLIRAIGYDPRFVHFHKGWFQHTLPRAHRTIDRIAILRIDADWYASTKICLEYLFDKVVSGGFVIIDDYGAYDGCRKAVNEFFLSSRRQFFLNYVNTDIRYIIIP